MVEVTTKFQTFLDATYSSITLGAPAAIGPVALAPAPISSIATTGTRTWSDNTVWGGSQPPAGSDVVIPVGMHLVLDANPAELGSVTVNGTLEFAPGSRALTAKSITINSSGAMKIGAPNAPFVGQATITLTGARPVFPADNNVPNTRGITVNGGKLELYGASPSPVWTQLNDHAAAGTKSMTLATPVNWASGEDVVVGPSDFYGVNPTERLALSIGGSTNVITTSAALEKFRWGKLQYMTDNGLSLTPGTFTPPKAPAPSVLDQRAAVANLSRNIVIQGVDDADWRDKGFGAHVMVMGLSSRTFVDGVQFRRVGQAGAMARYPFHWHMLSYAFNTAAYLGDATGQEIRNSTISDSAQRCIVIHGTNGVKVVNNVCYNIRGHAIFLEDGVERKNLIEGNLVLKVRNPKPGDLLLAHEGDVYQAGSSGFWITNPDNIIRNNVAADTQGNAYWNSFPTTGVGLSRKAVNPDLAGTQWANDQMRPRNMPHGVFENNVAYSTGGVGINTDFMLEGGGPVGNDRGETGPDMYLPTLDGRERDINGVYKSAQASPNTNCEDFPLPAGCRSINMRASFSRSTIYKANGGYRNRVGAPDYVEWIMADNTGDYASGAGNDGVFTRGLFIGQSLNHTPANYPQGALPPVMFATYHSTFQMRDSTMAHIGYNEGSDPEKTNSGVFKTDDYYMSMLERGTFMNAGNKLIDAFPGARYYPPNIQTRKEPNENYTLAAAIWDPYGYWNKDGTKGYFWTLDVPFLTAGGNCTPSLFPTPNGKNSQGKYNGQSCAGEYFGFTHQNNTDFLKAADGESYWPVDVERLDCDKNLFTSSSMGRASHACRWTVGPGYDSWKLGNFRGASLRNGGTFKVMFPTPEDRPGIGNYGRPVFSSSTKTGTMLDAEGKTVGISIPRTVNLHFTNLSRPTDAIVVAVSFDGAKTPAAILARTDNAWNFRDLIGPNPNPNFPGPEVRSRINILSLASTLDEVKNDPDGKKMWQDKANNLVWFKVSGKIPLNDGWYRIENFTAPFGQDIFQDISLYMEGK